MKEIVKLKGENESLNNTQGGAKKEESIDFVNNEVKTEKEIEKDRMSLKEIYEQQQMEHKENMEKEVIKVIKTKENLEIHLEFDY